jgi:hypothetical protein
VPYHAAHGWLAAVLRRNTCADIEVVTHAVDEREWAAWDDSCKRWPPLEGA